MATNRPRKFTLYQSIILYRKLSATQIFNGYEFLPPNHVLVFSESGIIHDMVQLVDAGDGIQHVEGIVCPGFINTHCHLELSYLKNVIPPKTGLIDFVSKVIGSRLAPMDTQLEAIEQAEAFMLQNGIVAVGDVCNTDSTLFQKKKQQLYYHNFIEVSGFPKEVADSRFEKIKSIYQAFKQNCMTASIVPHAPYSVSTSLLEKIVSFSNNSILSMHNQETEQENELYYNKSGDFIRFFNDLNIPTTSFEAFNSSSLQALLPYFNHQQSLLLVHNVCTNEDDVIKAQQAMKEHNSNVYFCLCPKANEYITGTLPDVDMLIKNNCMITLGTDSLASNDQLNILDEIHCIQKNFPQIPIESLLTWATSNGAKALGIDHKYGSFEKGKQPGIVLIHGSTSVRLD